MVPLPRPGECSPTPEYTDRRFSIRRGDNGLVISPRPGRIRPPSAGEFVRRGVLSNEGVEADIGPNMLDVGKGDAARPFI